MENKQNSTDFEWPVTSDKPVFPVDYSSYELASNQYWGIGRRKIGKYLLDTAFYKELHRKLLLSKGETNPSGKGKSIPYELEPFFREYMKTVDQFNDRGIKITGKIPDGFEKELCKNLYIASLESESRHSKPCSKDEQAAIQRELFCYRQLFENQFFQDVITSDMWEKEFLWRIDALIDLNNQQTPDMRIQLLKRVITYIDIQLAYLLQVNSNNQANDVPSSSSILNSFPLELLTKTRIPSDTGILPCTGIRQANVPGLSSIKYSIPNSKIEITDYDNVSCMAEAFCAVSKNNRNSTKIRSFLREAYQRAFCPPPEKSDFQNMYEDIKHYLKEYTKECSDEESTNEIWRYCSQYFGSIIRGCPIPPRSTMGSITSTDYTAGQYFLEELVVCFYTCFVLEYNWFLGFMRSFDEIDLFHDALQTYTHQKQLSENAIHLATSFISQLQTIWDEDKLCKFNALNGSTTQIEIQHMARQLGAVYHSVCSTLCPDTINPGNITYENVISALTWFCNIKACPERFYGECGSMQNQATLIKCVFAYHVWKESQIVERKALQMYTQIRAYIQKKGQA